MTDITHELTKLIKCLKRDQEHQETKIKLVRIIMDLHEKHFELITSINARELQHLESRLDGIRNRRDVVITRDVEVEKNEHNKCTEIEHELRALNRYLKVFEQE